MSSSVHLHNPPAASRVALDGDRIHVELVGRSRQTHRAHRMVRLARPSNARRTRGLRASSRRQRLWWERLEEGLSVPALMGVSEF